METTVTCPPSEQIAPAVQQEVFDSLELLDDLYEYNHHAYTAIRPFLKGRICEVGCGIGNVTQFLLNHEQVVALEPFDESYRNVQARFTQHKNIKIIKSWLSDCPVEEAALGSFDTVVCMRVLESVEDDERALTQMRKLCAPHGSVIILVAAHQSAYGTLDREYGHLRRYNRRHLGRMFHDAGLNPIDSFYMNAPGYFGWLWASRIRRYTRIPVMSAHMSNRLAPFLDAFERIIRLPFGQSLVMVGRPT